MIAFIAMAAIALSAQGQAPAQPPTQPPPQRQPQPQRRSTGGLATLAILVSDPSGAGIGDVKVTAQGPVNSDARTERGRIVFEECRPAPIVCGSIARALFPSSERSSRAAARRLT